MLTKAQFSLVGAYTRLCSTNSRFVIQQNIIVIYHLILMAVLYFHLLNICGFTSSVSCMSYEIIDSMLKSNNTFRGEAKVQPSDLNMTEFFDSQVDMYFFRVVTESMEDIIAGTSR